MTPTRRIVLAAASATASSCLGGRASGAVAQAAARPATVAPRPLGPSPEPIDFERWSRATHGYYMIVRGILAPGLLEGDSDDDEPWVFRPWHNVLLPHAALPRFADYYLQGFGGTDSGGRAIVMGRPVLPPVVTLDDQRLRAEWEGVSEKDDDRGTRLGYADVGHAWFFPWKGILIEPDRLPPVSREKLLDLRQAFRIFFRGSVDRHVHVYEIMTPPDRVGFVKSLYAPPAGEEPNTRGVTLFHATTGMSVSYSFGDEVLLRRE